MDSSSEEIGRAMALIRIAVYAHEAKAVLKTDELCLEPAFSETTVELSSERDSSDA